METKLSLFEGQSVRKIWFQNQWYFSVIDVIQILTWSSRPRKYWNDLKKKLEKEWSEVSEKIGHFKLMAFDWKFRETDCLCTENLLRLIQSIPSPKAEPFKLWLARVWYERMQEIENPQLAQERARSLFEKKGYPKDWIDIRMKGISVRQNLTDEWKQRGVVEKSDYALLTNEIAQATFDMTIEEHMQHKSLQVHHNLRDSMTEMELILSMLGEATTTSLHKKRDSKNIPQLKKDANDWWSVAWKTRKNIEEKLWEPVISPNNYRHLTQKKKKPLIIK